MFEQCFVARESRDSQVTVRFVAQLMSEGTKIHWDIAEHEIPGNLNPKKNIYLTIKKGGFVKPCPCTPHAICCGYYNINLIEGCPFECNYCALDIYLHSPVTKIYTNLELFEQELHDFMAIVPFARIGTGELSDSLVWDKYFSYSSYLKEIFERYPQSILELKTKSVEINELLRRVTPSPNLLISFSINAVGRAKDEERNLPEVRERLSAALQLKNKGFKIGFHFDPIYYYDGYEEDYLEIIDFIKSEFSFEQIGWISLGIIRFNAAMQEILFERRSRITLMELFPGHLDGKFRLFYPLRLKVYGFFLKELKNYFPKIYLCMETADCWQELGLEPHQLNEKLKINHFLT